MARTIFGFLVSLSLTGCGPPFSKCVEGQEGVYKGALAGDTQGDLLLDLNFWTDMWDKKPTEVEVEIELYLEDAPLNAPGGGADRRLECIRAWPSTPLPLVGHSWIDAEGVAHAYVGEIEGNWDASEEELDGTWWMDWSAGGRVSELEGSWSAQRIGP